MSNYHHLHKKSPAKNILKELLPNVIEEPTPSKPGPFADLSVLKQVLGEVPLQVGQVLQDQKEAPTSTKLQETPIEVEVNPVRSEDQSTSGRVELLKPGGCEDESTSGRVELLKPGECVDRSTSGRVQLLKPGGFVDRSTSGRVQLLKPGGCEDESTSGRVDLLKPGGCEDESTSGRVDLLKPGGCVDRSTSGRYESMNQAGVFDLTIVQKFGISGARQQKPKVTFTENDPTSQDELAPKDLDDSWGEESNLFVSPTCEKTMCEEFESRYTPRERLTFSTFKFAPVDVAKASETIFVTSQATNHVGIYRDSTFKGVLKIRGSEYFLSPRNVLCLPCPVKVNEWMVMILDDCGIRVFNEDGFYIKTLLEGHGRKYRGLAYYNCKKTKDEPASTMLVTIDVQNFKQGNELCIFTQESGDIKEFKRIRIDATRSLNDPKCRFVAVTTDKNETCSGHNAYITGMMSQKMYIVHISTGVSRAITLVNLSKDVTFSCTLEDEEVNIIKPTGICFDSHGNLLVADMNGWRVHLYAPNGLFLKSLYLTCQPIGIHFDESDQTLIVADKCEREVQIFKIFK